MDDITAGRTILAAGAHDYDVLHRCEKEKNTFKIIAMIVNFCRRPISCRTKLGRYEDTDKDLYRIVKKNSLFIPRNERTVSWTVRDDDAPLMWRGSTVEMFSALDAFVGGILRPGKGPEHSQELEDPAQTLIIRGNPGCGKTMTSWTFLKAYVTDTKLPCVWYSSMLGTLSYITPASNPNNPDVIGRLTTVEAPLSQILSKQDCTLCFIDSITSEALTNEEVINALKAICTQIPLILVMSMQADLNIDLKYYLKAREYSLKHWTLNEYIECCKNDEFFTSVFNTLNDTDLTLQECLDDPKLRTMLVQRKYRVAGVCARWMFDLTYEEVKDQIKYYLGRAPNYTDLLNANIGPSSPVAINALMYPSDYYDGKNSFTSDLVFRLLINMKRISTILDNAIQLASRINHPGLDRIVFEAEITAWVRESILTYLEDRLLKVDVSSASSASTRSFPPNELYRSQAFTFHKDILTMEEYRRFMLVHDIDNYPEGIWFVPNVYHNGEIDLVHIVRRNEELCMIFLQVTRQVGHKIKLYYFRQFLESYNLLVPAASKIKTMIVQVVVPFSKYASHHLPTTSEIEDERQVTRLRLKTLEVGPTVGPTINYELAAFERSPFACAF